MTIEAEQKEPQQIPAGQYALKITECKTGYNLAGAPILYFHAVVTEGEYTGQPLTFCHALGLYHAPLLRNLIEVCNIPRLAGGLVDLDSFANKSFVADVTIDPSRHFAFVNPVSLLTARCVGTQSGRFDCSQPNLSNIPRSADDRLHNLEYCAEAYAPQESTVDSVYCSCVTPQAKHIKFDTFEYDKCDACGKEIKT